MIDEDLGLHQHSSVHFWQSFQFLPVMPSTLICCSSAQQHLICWLPSCVIVPFDPPLMIRYLEIQLLISSDIQLHHLWSAFYMWYLDIDSDLYFRAMLRWFIVYFQFSYTCIHVGSIPYFPYDVFLTEHGYARLSMSWLSIFFHWFLAGWNLVKSSLVLAKFFLCA